MIIPNLSLDNICQNAHPYLRLTHETDEEIVDVKVSKITLPLRQGCTIDCDWSVVTILKLFWLETSQLAHLCMKDDSESSRGG